MSGEPIIATSARKHGMDDEEILHAYRNPIRIWEMGGGLTMIVGPAQDATFLEAGCVEGEDGVVIVHAMKARKKFLR